MNRPVRNPARGALPAVDGDLMQRRLISVSILAVMLTAAWASAQKIEAPQIAGPPQLGSLPRLFTVH